jgi:flagellum-specific peptidoglycan hydrolase FlgJ
VQSSRKARWQQATALVSLSTCGAMTGFSFAHGSVADLTSPSNIPVKLMALNKPARSAAASASASDSALRSAIVTAARHYLSLAQNRSPSAMEALIWQDDSMDGIDHGESCAAFASLTLESGAQATGQQSWVTGGTTYPWPVHAWVDSRVDPNPESPGVISILQDAQAHQRWHPIGDGYTPQPGDWVMFDGHVEVVTKYAGGVLSTIGGDSMPNLSVNAHQYDGPLAAQGVTGFVNNGVLLSAVSQTSGHAQRQSAASGGATFAAQGQAEQGQADVPGILSSALSLGGTAQSGGQAQSGSQAQSGGQSQSGGQAERSGSVPSAGADTALTATATIPGAVPVAGSVTSYSSVAPSVRYSRGQPAPHAASAADSSAQQAFIAAVAPGALAAQQQYGIPAAVTIAQAIDESGWGQSLLATQDNNLFGIKGTGPAGSVLRPTQEYQNGHAVTVNAPFRVYSSMAQSITDHSLLLATGSSYKQAMADRRSPDAFANDLTGVYATDPNYGASLITIMRQYNLYRFDAGTAAAHGTSQAQAGSARQGGAVGQSSSARQSGSVGQSSAVGHGGAAGQSSAAGQTGAAQIPGAVEVNTAGLGLVPASGSVATDHGTAGSATAAQAHAVQGHAVQGHAAQGHAARGHAARGGTGSGGSPPSGATAGRVGQDTSGADSEGSGGASIPGLDDYAGTAASASSTAATSSHLEPTGGQALRAGPRNLHVSTRRYVTQMPRTVLTDFVTTAKIPLLRAKPVYQQVAEGHGVRWELLAACDWMQCQAQPGVSPVYGEKLGTKNPDGTVYRTKADALEQCAADLIELAAAVYGINLRQRRLLSVRELANVFAAFRWGGLLTAHRISAMEFPYSVEGLTAAHMRMRWPAISDDAPDKPGTRFRMSFGAVPVVLRLNYPAVA